jgi:DsbC/DsbD-like thiol-disulfide interchange protein
MKVTWFILLMAAAAGNARATPVRDGPVQAELFAEVQAIVPGKPFTVAFRMAMDDAWHAYWTNPGDSGLPPSLEWTLPEGFLAGELHHPPPIAIPTPPFMTYGHEGDVLFLVTITPPSGLKEDRVTLRAEADWLVCRDLCLPGFAELELELPVQASLAPHHPEHAARIEQARGELPADPVGWRFHAQRASDRLRLHVLPPAAGPETIESATFFPFSPRVILHSAPQAFQSAGNGFVLELEPIPAASAAPGLSGVLVVANESGRRALRIDIPFSKADPPWFSPPERNTP